MKVKAATKDSHQRTKLFCRKIDKRQVGVRFACCLFREVVVVLFLVSGVLCVADGVETNTAGEEDNDGDENDAVRVDLVVDADVYGRSHPKGNHENDDAGVAVAELGPVHVVANRPRHTRP